MSFNLENLESRLGAARSAQSQAQSNLSTAQANLGATPAKITVREATGEKMLMALLFFKEVVKDNPKYAAVQTAVNSANAQLQAANAAYTQAQIDLQNAQAQDIQEQETNGEDVTTNLDTLSFEVDGKTYNFAMGTDDLTEDQRKEMQDQLEEIQKKQGYVTIQDMLKVGIRLTEDGIAVNEDNTKAFLGEDFSVDLTLSEDEEQNRTEQLKKVEDAVEETKVEAAIEEFNETMSTMVSFIEENFPDMDIDNLSDEDCKKIQQLYLTTQKEDGLEKTINTIEQYYATEGIADKGYNLLKSIFGGLTHEDISEYLQNEQIMNTALEVAAKNGEIKIVDDKDLNVEERINSCKSLQEVIDYVTQYLGLSEEQVWTTIENNENLYLELVRDKNNQVIGYNKCGSFASVNDEISFGDGGNVIISEIADNLNTDELTLEQMFERGQMSKSALNEIIVDRLESCQTLEEIIEYSTKYLGLSEEEIDSFIENSTGLQASYNEDNTICGVTYSYATSSSSRQVKQVTENFGLQDNLFTTKANNGVIPISTLLCGLSESVSQEYLSNSPDSLSFEQAYSFFTGVEYNEEAIQEANEAYQPYEYIMQQQEQISYQQEMFKNATPQEVFAYYEQIAQGMEGVTAADLFNKYYANMFNQAEANDLYVASDSCNGISISDDGNTLYESYWVTNESQIEQYIEDGYIYDEDTKSVIKTVDLLEEGDRYNSTRNCFKAINQQVSENNLSLQQYIEDFDELYGHGENSKTYQEIIDDYNEKAQAAFGTNILNAKFSEYQNDMDSYAQKLSSALSMAGFVGSFIPGMQWMGLVALAGQYTDNVIDLTNLATNKVDSEFGEWMLQTGKEVAFTMIGMKLGKACSALGDRVAGSLIVNTSLSNQTARYAGTGVEYVADCLSGTAFDITTDTVEYFLNGGDPNKFGEFFGNDILNNLKQNALFSSSDLRGGIGLYRALQGDGSFDVEFHDGTKVSYDAKTGDATKVNADGEVTIKSSEGIMLRGGSVFDIATGAMIEAEIRPETEAEVRPEAEIKSTEEDPGTNNCELIDYTTAVEERITEGLIKSEDVEKLNVTGIEDQKLAALSNDAIAKLAGLDGSTIAKFANLKPEQLEKLSGLSGETVKQIADNFSPDALKVLGSSTDDLSEKSLEELKEITASGLLGDNYGNFKNAEFSADKIAQLTKDQLEKLANLELDKLGELANLNGDTIKSIMEKYTIEQYNQIASLVNKRKYNEGEFSKCFELIKNLDIDFDKLNKILSDGLNEASAELKFLSYAKDTICSNGKADYEEFIEAYVGLAEEAKNKSDDEKYELIKGFIENHCPKYYSISNIKAIANGCGINLNVFSGQFATDIEMRKNDFRGTYLVELTEKFGGDENAAKLFINCELFKYAECEVEKIVGSIDKGTIAEYIYFAEKFEGTEMLDYVSNPATFIEYLGNIGIKTDNIKTMNQILDACKAPSTWDKLGENEKLYVALMEYKNDSTFYSLVYDGRLNKDGNYDWNTLERTIGGQTHQTYLGKPIQENERDAYCKVLEEKAKLMDDFIKEKGFNYNSEANGVLYRTSNDGFEMFSMFDSSKDEFEYKTTKKLLGTKPNVEDLGTLESIFLDDKVSELHFTSRRPISTTSNPNYDVNEFASNGSAPVIKYEIQYEGKAMPMEVASDHARDEYETLLPTGCKYEVTGIRIENGHYVFSVNITPPQ